MSQQLAERLARLSPEQRALLEDLLRERQAPPAAAPAGPATPTTRALSFAQQRLWFLDRLEPGSAAYNVAGAVRLDGPLDAAALAASLDAVVARHQILRATYREREGQPEQEIAPALRLPLPRVDLTALPVAARVAELARLAADESLRPFDLARGPLLRATLVRLEPLCHAALFTMHHIVSDARSLRILFGELGAFYAAARTGGRAALPALSVQYPDYAEEQRRELSGGHLDGLLAFWTRQLAGTPPAPRLPADRPHPVQRSLRGHHHRATLPPGLEGALRGLGREQRATLFMVLLAAYAVFLHRVAGETDLWLAVPVANRDRRGAGSLIGFFVNTLVLRIDAAGNPAARELLGRVRETALAAFAHQELPFERLVEELRPERDLSVQPLTQLALNVQEDPSEAFELPGLRITPLPPAGGTAKFDLEVTVFVAAAGLTALLEANADLFDAATNQRLLALFQASLEAMAADPGQRISCLPLLGPAERQQLLVEWNDTGCRLLAGTSFYRLFAEWVERRSAACALAHGAARWTYAGLAAAASALAWQMADAGLGEGDVVALLAGRGAALVTGMLATLAAGACYLPLDPLHPPARHRQLLAGSRARLVLAEPALVPRLAETLAGMAEAERPPAGEIPVWPETDGGPPLAPPFPDGSLVYVIYTSGSTGAPKGAMIEQGSMLNHLWAKVAALDLTPDDAVAFTAAPSFDVSVWQMLAPLLAGGRVEVFDDEEVRDPRRLLAEAAVRGVTVLEVVPSWLQAALGELRGGEAPPLGALRWLVVTGEELAPDLCRGWLALYPRVPLLNAYGPTECADDVAHHPVAVPPPAGARRVPIGRPLPNTRLYVLDRHLHPLALGAVGELCVGGAGVGRGYLDDPARTAEAFVPDSWAAPPGGGRLYRTGDLARLLPSSAVDFLGRRNRQVKIRGARIEPGEIEAVLGEHPEVAQAVVLPRDDAAGRTALVAWVVPRAGSAPSPDAMRVFLAARLPAAMVPSAFVPLQALPLSASGKVDRARLPDPGTGGAGAAPSDALRGPVEELLAGIWSDVLGVSGVGPEDHFFDLGGHSLLAVRVASRAREAFGVDLPLRRFFEEPTLAGLARAVTAELARGPAGELPPIVPGTRDGDLPLSFAQERLWFLAQLDPASWAYNIPAAVELTGELDGRALAASLAAVVRRHEALRSTFPTVDGRPALVLAPAEEAAPMLPRVDLSRLPDGLRRAEERRLAGEEARRPFDLARGPLLRACLLAGGADRHVVLLTLHHTVADGWSLGLLLRELAAGYAAARAGVPAPLPPLPVQYVDYARWQRGWMAGPRLDAQLDFWSAQLAGTSDLALPADRPRPAVPSPRGGHVSRVLPPSLAAALRGLARQRGATLYMVLLAGFQALLSRLAGQTDFAVGTPVAHRGWLEIEELIGFFVNTLALRARLGGDPPFREVLARVRGTHLAAAAHQDLPFEKLVERLQPARSFNRSPLFQVLLDLQEPPADPTLPGLRLRRLEIETGTAQFDLTLALVEERGGPSGLSASWGFLADLFDRTTVERLAGRFELLLAAWAEDPERRLGEPSLLTAAEAAQTLQEWNDTAADLPVVGVHDLFAAQAARTPDACALRAGDLALSYAGLDRRSRALARRLRAAGVGREVLVGLCARRSPEVIVGMLGVLRAGGAYLPLDPDLPRERLELLLADAGPALVLAPGNLAPLLPVGVPRLPLDISAAEPPPAGEEVDAVESLAYVLYTSGSTGRPKGVMVGHAGLANYVVSAGRRYGLGPGDRVLQRTPFTFDVSAEEIYGALAHGATLELDEGGKVDAVADLFAAWDLQGVTILDLPVALWHEIVRALEEGLALPPAVRLVLIAGEATSAGRVDAWRRAAPAGIRLFNNYGPTEATIVVTRCDLSAGAPLSLGRPLENVRVRVLGEALGPLPPGVPGELYLGGVALARGYLGRPDLTASSFLPDPWTAEPGARLYRTGDRARWAPDGTLEFLGRADGQVKIRGHRVELLEVESVLAGCPAVREAAVTVAGGGADHRRLVAWVVRAPDAEEGLDLAAAVRRHLAARLPEPMVPTRIAEIAALPHTPSGKVDRRALAALEPPEVSRDLGWDEPDSAAERCLARLWEDLLEVGRVGLHDNFFDLGGDSILSVRLVAAAMRAGLRITTQQVFQHQTVAALAAVAAPVAPDESAAEGLRMPADESAAAARLAGAEGLEAVQPLSPYQEYLLDRFLAAPDPGHFLVVANHRLRGGVLDAGAFAAAWQTVVDRHAPLRSGLVWEGLPRPLAVVLRRAEVQLVEEDWRGLTAGQQDERLRAWLRGLRYTGLDPARPPHTWPALFRTADDGYIFSWGFDHAWQEGWSYSLILRDVLDAYAALAAGRRPELPPLPCTYASYLAWIARQDPAAAEAFWRGELAGFAGPTPIPGLTGRPGPGAGPEAERRGRLQASLSAETTGELVAAARRGRLTLATFLQGAWALTLSAASGAPDVLFGVGVAGRPPELPGIDELVGSTLNVVPLRARIDPAVPLGEWLADLQARRSAAARHELAPPLRVARWSGLSEGRPLFHSHLVVERFPIHPRALAAARQWQLEPLESDLPCWDVPLRIEAELEGALRLTVLHDTAVLSAAAAGELLADFRGRLAGMAGVLDRPLGRLAGYRSA